MKTFENWMKVVDSLISAKLGGMDSGDLPDIMFVRDFYDDGMTPTEAAETMLETWAEEGDIPFELI